MNVPTHGTDHHGEVRGSTLGREEDGFPFLLVAFRSWYKYKRESAHGSASCRTCWLERNNIGDGTSATRVPRMHRSLALLRDRTRRPTFSINGSITQTVSSPLFPSRRVVRARSRSNPDESVHCIAAERTRKEKKDYQQLSILAKIFYPTVTFPPSIFVLFIFYRECVTYPSNDTYTWKKRNKAAEIVEWKSLRSKIFRAEILIEVATLDATLGETKKIRSTEEVYTHICIYTHMYIRYSAPRTRNICTSR